MTMTTTTTWMVTSRRGEREAVAWQINKKGMVDSGLAWHAYDNVVAEEYFTVARQCNDSGVAGAWQWRGSGVTVAWQSHDAVRPCCRAAALTAVPPCLPMRRNSHGDAPQWIRRGVAVV